MAAMNASVRIALIHALSESVEPARAAFAEQWPDAYCFDLLDTSLADDRADRAEIDPTMIERFISLAAYARSTVGRSGKTAGILFTCSAFGPAIDAVKACSTFPVLRPNEAAFDAAMKRGDCLGLVVSFQSSLASLEDEFSRLAEIRGRAVVIKSMCVGDALAALKRGEGDTHDRLVAEAAARTTDVDALILGQFSMARAQSAVERVCALSVITTPRSAVDALRRAVMIDRSEPIQ
jgi:Asp/Glu/hydantoin racemase